ncbi:MAG: tetratricopeptide repeat protein [Smithellaceae bacterium]|nr:tetratricopeptide repeat protein [Smithellaceae bacterium]
MTEARAYADRIIGLERMKDYRGAYDALREALTIYPTNLFLLRNEVYLLLRLGKTKEAKSKAEARVELLKNDSFFLRTYLMVLQREKAGEDLENLINAILSWGVGDEDLMVFMVDTATKSLGSEKGRGVLHQAQSRFPVSETLKRLAASGEEKRGGGSGFTHYQQKFAALKPAEAALEIEAIMVLPAYAEDFELQHYLADLYKKMERYEQAVEIYLRLLARRDQPFTRKMLGYAYYKMGDKDQALIHLRAVFVQSPDDHYVARTLFKLYEEKADYGGLEMLVREALAARPEAKHLYGLLKKAGRWRKNSATS